MTGLARTGSNCKRQTYRLVRGNVTKAITASVKLEKKNTGRESRGACHHDELIGVKPPVIKLSLTLSLQCSERESLMRRLEPGGRGIAIVGAAIRKRLVTDLEH
jgi:hypothetical protein